MLQELQAGPTANLSVALDGIKAAIQDAWTDTRTQMEEYQFHQSVVHTAFGQFLVHNVRNRVFQSDSPGMISHLMPNRRGSAYHLKVIIMDKLFLTISAVENQESPPRPARFRSDYAGGQQSWFRVTAQDEFEPLPPAQSTAEYIQILHGPQGLRGQKRQKLGFIYVAFPHSRGVYRRPPIPLDAYIAELSKRKQAEIEFIEEEDGLGVALKREAISANK